MSENDKNKKGALKQESNPSLGLARRWTIFDPSIAQPTVPVNTAAGGKLKREA
jgi:hypothetical protein